VAGVSNLNAPLPEHSFNEISEAIGVLVGAAVLCRIRDKAQAETVIRRLATAILHKTELHEDANPGQLTNAEARAAILAACDTLKDYLEAA
jgi:hypothetical protein